MEGSRKKYKTCDSILGILSDAHCSLSPLSHNVLFPHTEVYPLPSKNTSHVAELSRVRVTLLYYKCYLNARLQTTKTLLISKGITLKQVL